VALLAETSAEQRVRPAVAWVQVGSAMAASALLLAATSARYDYHRDELYFRMLPPAWGYVDQPPLTPWLARVATGLFGDSVWAMRIPAIMFVAATILLAALTTRELGGGRWPQGLSAWGIAFATLPLVFGHVLFTGTVDLVVWAAVILFVVRALLRDEPRWFLAAGAAAGVGLYNKHLVVMLLIGLAIGLLAVGPRHVFRSRWLWAGVGTALVIGLPNLIYQATHDWPQLSMAGALAENNGGENRAMLLPFQLLLLGPPLVAIWVAGFVALLRRPAWRPLRAVALAYPVVLLITFASGGQIYYPLGLMVFLFAAGSVPTIDWIARRPRVRRPLVAGAVAINAVVTAVLALPLVPVDRLGRTPIPEINQVARDQVGWPVYTRQVADAFRSLPQADAAKAVVITANYGEAGALERYGPQYGLPAVYSGHNQLWFFGPPPEAATVAVTVGLPLRYLRTRFGSCVEAGQLDNGVDVANEEQGATVAVCRDPAGGWAAAWPDFQHYD
jgi:hypothetical protein